MHSPHQLVYPIITVVIYVPFPRARSFLAFCARGQGTYITTTHFLNHLQKKFSYCIQASNRSSSFVYTTGKPSQLVPASARDSTEKTPYCLQAQQIVDRDVMRNELLEMFKLFKNRWRKCLYLFKLFFYISRGVFLLCRNVPRF